MIWKAKVEETDASPLRFEKNTICRVKCSVGQRVHHNPSNFYKNNCFVKYRSLSINFPLNFSGNGLDTFCRVLVLTALQLQSTINIYVFHIGEPAHTFKKPTRLPAHHSEQNDHGAPDLGRTSQSNPLLRRLWSCLSPLWQLPPWQLLWKRRKILCQRFWQSQRH